MGSIPKVIGVLSCSFLLCLSLSTVASSADKLTTDQFVPGKEIKGEIVKVEGDNYVVRDAAGTEVRMHVDASTHKKSNMRPKVGEHVHAKVNAKGHAVSFLTDAPTSR